MARHVERPCQAWHHGQPLGRVARDAMGAAGADVATDLGHPEEGSARGERCAEARTQEPKAVTPRHGPHDPARQAREHAKDRRARSRLVEPRLGHTQRRARPEERGLAATGRLGEALDDGEAARGARRAGLARRSGGLGCGALVDPRAQDLAQLDGATRHVQATRRSAARGQRADVAEKTRALLAQARQQRLALLGRDAHARRTRLRERDTLRDRACCVARNRAFQGLHQCAEGGIERDLVTYDARAVRERTRLDLFPQGSRQGVVVLLAHVQQHAESTRLFVAPCARAAVGDDRQPRHEVGAQLVGDGTLVVKWGPLERIAHVRPSGVVARELGHPATLGAADALHVLPDRLERRVEVDVTREKLSMP